jgi:hypothetical protein
MDTSTIVGWSGLVLSILGIIYSAINHKHCKVLLCGRRLEFGIDVDSTDTFLKNQEEEKKKEEIKRKLEEEKKKKDDDIIKKTAEDEKRKILYTPHVFKIQPLNI